MLSRSAISCDHRIGQVADLVLRIKSMGISADRLTGYFFTSASKRAASCGEKIDIVSISSLMHQLPRPRLCYHIHFFLGRVCRISQSAGFRQLQYAGLSIFALP